LNEHLAHAAVEAAAMIQATLLTCTDVCQP
jgi:hypothetical protein